MRWRWGNAKNPNWRYTGPLLRNGIARLWWLAELTRNGPDYSAIPRRVRSAQFACELKYSWYRPATIAFVRVADGLDGGPALTDDEMVRLSVRLNVVLPTLSLEGMTDSVEEGELDDPKWRDYHPSLEELVANGLPEGPTDRIVPDKVLEDLGDWYRGLLKPPPEGTEDTDEP